MCGECLAVLCTCLSMNTAPEARASLQANQQYLVSANLLLLSSSAPSLCRQFVEFSGWLCAWAQTCQYRCLNESCLTAAMAHDALHAHTHVDTHVCTAVSLWHGVFLQTERSSRVAHPSLSCACQQQPVATLHGSQSTERATGVCVAVCMQMYTDLRTDMRTNLHWL